MKQGCKYIATLLIILLAASLLQGQVKVKASVDRARILIGEPVLLTVEAYVPLGLPVLWFSTDTFPHFEIIEEFKTDTVDGIDGKKISQLVSLTSFDSGRWVIPALEINVAGQPYYTDSIPVDISFVSFDPQEDYRDIKDIEEVINPYTKYIPWIFGATILISLVLIIYLLKKRKRVSDRPRIKSSTLSPYDEAIKAITELRTKGLPSPGEEKAFYSKLSDIFGVFVFRKLSISTVEKTSDELIVNLSVLNIPKESFNKLVQSLRMSDFVKFAKYRPEEKDNLSNIEVIRASIEILDNNTIRSAV